MTDDPKPGRERQPRGTRKAGNRFNLVLVPAVSAALLAFGCDHPSSSPARTIRVCVDPDGRRLPDVECSYDHFVDTSSFHRWYSTSGVYYPPIGAYIGGAAFRSTGGFGGFHSGLHSTGAHGISRGGFGSSAHAHGAGG
jgi:hypothetical protein